MIVRSRLKFFFLIFLLFGCFPSNECPHNYHCTDSFKSVVGDTDYCGQVNRILEGDSTLFNQFLNPPVHSGLIIDHANNVCQIVLDLGKERICRWISDGVVDSKKLFDIMNMGNYKILYQERENYFTKNGELNCEDDLP